MKLNDIVAFSTCVYLQCDSIMVANISLADFFYAPKDYLHATTKDTFIQKSADLFV